ncbi:non-specific serine/threonine protein kinase [Chromobacterium violaceum]|uniref:protein kinase domain-containing protein n=1 Tax=Chromobacterium violaceum TaxID=536 RepID=UPI003CFAD6C1
MGAQDVINTAKEEQKIPRQELILTPKATIYSNSSAAYKVIERLGRGGNSDVYLCQSNRGDQKGLLFAAKLMTNIDRADRVKRFEKEFDFLSGINHPAIMKVIERGEFSFGSGSNRIEVPFYLAEYIPLTLRDAMRSGLLMVDKVSIAVQLLSLLNSLSQLTPPVVHRDIKPENIFIRGRSAVLGDFGLLKALEPEDLEQRFAIGDLSRGVRHPFSYPTPDLIDYAKGKTAALTPKSDVFQLGLVFSEMFCGHIPIGPRVNALDPIVVEKLESFSASNAQTILSLIRQMLELDPNQRGSADVFLDQWMGVFSEVVTDAQRLEGKAFW